MSFLDRFKTTPKYRNPDPAVRLAGVAELPDDAESWGVIAELAASDEDVRVRRAAVERLGAVGYLARIARTERDESLRRDLADRLVAIANAGASTDADAATALEGAQRPEALRLGRQVLAARGSPDGGAGQDSGREGAGERCPPCRRAPDCARSGRHASTIPPSSPMSRRKPITRKPESAPSSARRRRRPQKRQRRELLDGIAGRAKNKSVAKRARALVQEIDDAEAARVAAHEEAQKRVAARSRATRRHRQRAGRD